MYGDIKTLLGDGDFTRNLREGNFKALAEKSIFSDQRKINALKSIASRIMAEYAFQVARAFTTFAIKSTADAALNAITGIEPPEQKDDEFMWKLHSEVVRNMAFSMLGNLSTDFATDIINGISNKATGTDLLYKYKKDPNRPPDYFGAFTIGANSLDKAKYYREILETTDTQGNPVPVSNAEKMILGADWIANALAFKGLLPSDVKQVVDRMAARVHREKDYKDEKIITVGGPNQAPRIKIDGQEVDWQPEQLEYFREQKRYHLEEMENSRAEQARKERQERHLNTLSTEQEKRDYEKKIKEENKAAKEKQGAAATAKAKADLKKRYGKAIKKK